MAETQTETFRKAGSKFGIDLKGLFEEDEEGNSTPFGGLVPGLKTTSQLKGRSPGTATFKAPSTPARTTEFTLTTPLSTAASAAPAKAVEKEAPEKVYYGSVGGVGVEDIGGQGFGLKDLQAARDAGYSEQSIKDYVESQRGNLFNIGEGAQKELGIQGYVSTTPGVFNYAAAGGEGFGLKDLEALRARGVSDADARKLAAQAPMIGSGAAAALNVAPSRSQQAEVTARNYDPGSHGGSGFGMKDFNALAAQGVSTAQMREIAKRSPTMGPEARARLGL
jgi:hypothetical protein